MNLKRIVTRIAYTYFHQGMALKGFFPKTHTWELVMQNLVTRYIKDESGATAIEYGLIAALIAVSIIVAARGVGTSLQNKFAVVSAEVNGA